MSSLWNLLPEDTQYYLLHNSPHQIFDDGFYYIIGAIAIAVLFFVYRVWNR